MSLIFVSDIISEWGCQWKQQKRYQNNWEKQVSKKRDIILNHNFLLNKHPKSHFFSRHFAIYGSFNQYFSYCFCAGFASSSAWAAAAAAAAPAAKAFLSGASASSPGGM